MAKEGVLLAVSTDVDSYDEYLDYIDTLPESGICFIGDYAEFIEVKAENYVQNI